MSVVLRRTVFDNGDWRFDNLSGSHHQSRVKDCCQSNVLTPLCIHWLVSFAVMLRSIAPIATPPTSMKLAKTSQLETSDEERRCQQSHCWTSPTYEPHCWLGLCAMLNLQHQLLSMNDWKAGLLTWNRLSSSVVNHCRHYTNNSFMTLTIQTNRTEQPNFTNRSKPTNHDWPTPLKSYTQ